MYHCLDEFSARLILSYLWLQIQISSLLYLQKNRLLFIVIPYQIFYYFFVSTLHTDHSCILLDWKLWRLQYSGSTFILK